MNQQEFHQRKTVYVYPSCVAHHSCKASRQDSTARANVQSFSSIIQLVVKKLQGIGMLGKEGTQEDHCITTHLSAVHNQWSVTQPVPATKLVNITYLFLCLLPLVKHNILSSLNIITILTST